MSVERYQMTQNGQEVQQGDLNLLGDTGGLADDKVFAELLRLAPFTKGGAAAKAILPSATAPTVAPAGATGSVIVSPFRAIVGSRDTAANIGPLKNWNDLRSAVFVGPNALSVSQPLQANATNEVRWDLLYARLQVDAPGAQTSRYAKSPSTEQVAVVQIPTTLVQAISLGVTQGTPGGPKPTLPPDGGGTYFFPLAYVRIPANFGPLSTVASTDIEELIPYTPIASTTGAASLVPANQQYKEGGTVLSSAAFGWGSGGGRPAPVLPPTMSGQAGLLVAIDAQSSNSANWSHQFGAVVDDSRDWRNRIWRWFAMYSPTPTSMFPWSRSANLQFAVAATGAASNMTWGFGQSFAGDGYDEGPNLNGMCVVAMLEMPGNLQALNLPLNTNIALYVDPATGILHVAIQGTPGLRVFFWLEASGPFANY